MSRKKVAFPWGEVYLPTVPNFILDDDGSTPVYKFTDGALKIIAREWTKELIRNAHERREKARKKRIWP